MKKLLLFFGISLVAGTTVHAQSIYAEIGGPGLASINFDTRFGKSESGIGGRVGVGGFSVDGDGVVTIPIGLNYLLGKDHKNYFELGAGVTPLFVSGKDISGNFSSTFGHIWIGYRLQPQDGGFTFRAGICPIFGNGFFVPYYAGLSFGYKF